MLACRDDSIISTELFVPSGILDILSIILCAFFSTNIFDKTLFSLSPWKSEGRYQLMLLKLFEILKRKEGNTIIVNKISNMVVMHFKTTGNISKKEGGFQKVANQFCPHAFHLCD